MTLEDKIEVLADVAMIGQMDYERIEPYLDRTKLLVAKLESLVTCDIEVERALEYLFKKYGV